MPNIKKIILILPLVILVVGSLGTAFYFYREFQKTKIDSVEDLVAQISQFMYLPDEKPTLATVTDPEKLKDQPFFARAKSGNKVLIFTQAQKAILYDPEAKKIIDVTSLNTNN